MERVLDWPWPGFHRYLAPGCFQLARGNAANRPSDEFQHAAQTLHPEQLGFEDSTGPTLLIAQGKPKMVALIAAMRKLLTILNVMIRNETMWQKSPQST